MVECPFNSQKTDILSKQKLTGQENEKWREFVQSVVGENKQVTESVQTVQPPPLGHPGRTSLSRCPPPFKGVDSGQASAGLDNVILGPWAPATPEQVEEERRRVLEAEPRRWWWRPRYRLAELERGGMEREQAVALVRAEEA